MKRAAKMRPRAMTPDPDAAAKAAYAEWRDWHGVISLGVPLGIPQKSAMDRWNGLTENRKALWRRIAAAARRDA